MKQTTFLFIIFLFIGCSVSKEIHNEISVFQLKRIKLKDIEKIETENNGIQDYENPPTSQGYFSDLNEKYKFSQPKFYNRKQGSLKTEVTYYNSEKDSVVRLISYAWDGLKNSDSIRSIYNQNEKIFTEYFKKNGTVKNINEKTYWEDEITWENKKITVFQFILGDKKGAYRTRTIIRWK